MVCWRRRVPALAPELEAGAGRAGGGVRLVSPHASGKEAGVGMLLELTDCLLVDGLSGLQALSLLALPCVTDL